MGCEQVLTGNEERVANSIAFGIAYERKFVCRRMREQAEKLKNDRDMQSIVAKTCLALLKRMADELEKQAEDPDVTARKIVLAARPKSCRTKEG